MAYATSPVQYQINIRPIHMVMAVFAGMLFTVPLVVLLTTSIVGAKTDAVLAAAQQSNQAAVSCVDSAPTKAAAGVDSEASQSNDVAVVGHVHGYGHSHGYVSQSNSNVETTTSTSTVTNITDSYKRIDHNSLAMGSFNDNGNNRDNNNGNNRDNTTTTNSTSNQNVGNSTNSNNGSPINTGNIDSGNTVENHLLSDNALVVTLP